MQLHTSTDTLKAADLQLPNDADPLAQNLACVHTIELHFPAFSDGRAFSQALMLRRRCGFKGDIRATGDVLVDQLSQMQRCGFSSAVLRADQNLAKGRELLAHFSGFYQGDVTQPQPLFAR
jgi:uncharacterized protein (DUF934 family)